MWIAIRNMEDYLCILMRSCDGYFKLANDVRFDEGHFYLYYEPVWDFNRLIKGPHLAF